MTQSEAAAALVARAKTQAAALAALIARLEAALKESHEQR